MVVQLSAVAGQYKNKSLLIKLQECLICLFFLRPAVDAYRISTNHTDDDATWDQLSEVGSARAKRRKCGRFFFQTRKYR